eukprot:11167793-Lingulodinium_polyedra.AAC.1
MGLAKEGVPTLRRGILEPDVPEALAELRRATLLPERCHLAAAPNCGPLASEGGLDHHHGLLASRGCGGHR